MKYLFLVTALISSSVALGFGGGGGGPGWKAPQSWVAGRDLITELSQKWDDVSEQLKTAKGEKFYPYKGSLVRYGKCEAVRKRVCMSENKSNTPCALGEAEYVYGWAGTCKITGQMLTEEESVLWSQETYPSRANFILIVEFNSTTLQQEYALVSLYNHQNPSQGLICTGCAITNE